MKKQTIIIMALSILCIVSITIISMDRLDIDICKTDQVKNESVAIGFQQGVDYWNNAIVYFVNTNNEIPYIVNNTIQTLPISQLCPQD